MVVALTRIQRHAAVALAEGRRREDRLRGDVVYRHRQGDQRTAAVVAVLTGHIVGGGGCHVLRGGVQGGVALRVAVPRQRVVAARRRQRHRHRSAVGDILRHRSGGKCIEGACHRHAGGGTAIGVLHRHVAGDGRSFSDGLAHDVAGRARGDNVTVVQVGRLIPVKSTRRSRGRKGQGSRSALMRGHRRDSRGVGGGRFCHGHARRAGTAVQGAGDGVGAAGADRERGVGCGVVRPEKRGTNRGEFSRQRSAATRADGRGARDGHRRCRVDCQVMGCRSRTAIGRTRDGIVIGCTRVNGVCSGTGAPRIGGSTGCRQDNLIRATGYRRAGNGHGRQGIDGHGSRGGIGATEAVGTRHAVSTRLGNREGIGCRCAVRPAIILLSGGAVRRKGGRSTSVHGSVGAVVDGNGRQGFHIHESGGCSRTTVRAGTGHGILGTSRS